MKLRQSMICLSSSYRIAFLFYSLVMPVLTITTLSSASYNGGNETDHQALLKFKSMVNDPHGALTSWNTSSHFCDWSGVLCGKRHRRVTGIRLVSQGLEGSLSPLVGNLSFLRVLLLKNNSFHGTIPYEIGRLSRLRSLSLSQNRFNGLIPTNLSGCPNLEMLSLGYNKLVGSIPKEIRFLSKLIIFAVDNNKLTGGIPHYLGNMTSIEVFSVTKNPLGGIIPETLGCWKNLREFYSGRCNLTGTIPHSIYNLSLLTLLSLSNNQLSGSLLPAIGAMLPNLEHIQLWNNQLTGSIPSSISNCSNLRTLETTSNNLIGKLTIDFGKLTNISHIFLAFNHYGSEDDDELKFLDSLKNCSRLKMLALNNCNFQGVLPTSIGNLSQQLQTLTLGENKLHGNLPTGIGNLVGLSFLNLAGNRFTGKIPFSIGMLHNLQLLKLQRNQFSGPVPDAIGNLSLLITLSLTSNRLEGHIPTSLGNCHHLSELYLEDNRLSGKIPKTLLQLSSLSITLNLAHNNLFGSLPTEVGDLKMLSALDLSDNNLSGNIPSSLGGCTSLTWLSLKGNLFQGMIPSSLSSLRGLTSLDLSSNKLSGQIPRFLEQFSVEYVNLSNNDFVGEVPVLGVFANSSAFSVLGNRRLCGGLVELGLPKCQDTKKGFPLFVIVILIASTLLLFTILCLVYVWYKKKSKGQPSQSSRKELFLKVSYNQLLKATDGFSRANLIGEGGFSSVYKGNLDGDGKVVAVKVLHLQNQGAHKSFIAECEAWRSIRHRNLLKIITSCSSVDHQGNDFKALVYEFIPNGTLHDWLHSSERNSRLNLLQRINILMDVASALDYLHNQCLPSVVHGDLKPNNILLDDDMVAHVGDFGLARFIGINSNQNSSTGVKGTIGYVPPEYGMGSEMTRSGDAYSFGILLLEVMTGKNPTSGMFNEGLSLHQFVSMALPDHVTDIVDGDAIVMQSTEANAKKMEECIASTVKIGVACSVDSPPQRMNIENVVHELQHILDALQNI